MTTIILFVVGILLGSTGALLMKRGAMDLPPFAVTFDYAWAFGSNRYIIAGFALYLIPALIWTYLLSKLPVSVVQPVLSLTYVLTPLLAMIFLSEPVPGLRWVGILVIVVGVSIVSVS